MARNKRKRSRSVGDNRQEDTNPPEKLHNSNPFLSGYAPDNQTTAPWIDAVADFEQAPLIHADTLIQCLRTTTDTNAPPTHELIALLLSWAIPCAIQQAPESMDKVVWEALEVCLQHNDDSTLWLTQSHLFKLLPKLAIHCMTWDH